MKQMCYQCVGAFGKCCLVQMSKPLRFLPVRSKKVGGEGQLVLGDGSVSVLLPCVSYLFLIVFDSG